MANGEAPYLWGDHDRWIREVYVLHQQEDLLAHAEWKKGQERLETLIFRAAVSIGGTMLLLLGGVIANLWVALSHHP